MLETVNLMAGGYPHRMRFKAFNARYKMLAPFKRLKRSDDKALDDCRLILQAFQLQQADLMLGNSSCGGGNSGFRQPLPKDSNVSTSWSLGKRHIFLRSVYNIIITIRGFCTDNNVVFFDLSEGARQQLESLRADTRHRAAVSIQSTWRGWHLRRRWPTVKRQLELHSRRANAASAVSSGSAGTIPSGQQQQTQQQHAIQQLHHHSQQHPAASSTLNRHLAQQQQSQPTVHQPQSGPVQQQSFGRPRPQPIACTPPPEGLLGSSSGNTTGMTQSITAGQQHQQHQEKCDAKTIQHTCSLFGLDLVSRYSFTLAPDGINVNPIHWGKKITGW